MDQDKLKLITEGVYQYIDRAIKKSGFNLKNNRKEIQNAIEEIRSSYEQRIPPDFSSEIARLGYFIHYHPVHMIAAWQFFDKNDQELQHALTQSKICGFDIGCGAGAISLALDAHRKKSSTWTYIDREPDWGHLISNQRFKNDQGLSTFNPVIPFDFKKGSPTKNRERLDSLIKKQQVIVSMALITELGIRSDYYLKKLLYSCSPGTLLILGDVVGEGNRSVVDLFSKSFLGFETIKKSSISQRIFKEWICNDELAEIYRYEDNMFQKKNLSFHFIIFRKSPNPPKNHLVQGDLLSYLP